MQRTPTARILSQYEFTMADSIHAAQACTPPQACARFDKKSKGLCGDSRRMRINVHTRSAKRWRSSLRPDRETRFPPPTSSEAVSHSVSQNFDRAPKRRLSSSTVDPTKKTLYTKPKRTSHTCHRSSVEGGEHILLKSRVFLSKKSVDSRGESSKACRRKNRFRIRQLGDPTNPTDSPQFRRDRL